MMDGVLFPTYKGISQQYDRWFLHFELKEVLALYLFIICCIKRNIMKRKIRFDPAWTMLLSVIGTLVTMNFIDDQHARNVLAGVVLFGCLLLFCGSLVRNFEAK